MIFVHINLGYFERFLGIQNDLSYSQEDQAACVQSWAGSGHGSCKCPAHE